MSQNVLNQIDYTVACVFEFANAKKIPLKDAFSYLLEYRGIAFLKNHYEVEHLLSFEDGVDDLTLVCKKNGGYLS